MLLSILNKDYYKTKTKKSLCPITNAESNEPIKTRSKQMQPTRNAGKCVRVSHDLFGLHATPRGEASGRPKLLLVRLAHRGNVLLAASFKIWYKCVFKNKSSIIFAMLSRFRLEFERYIISPFETNTVNPRSYSKQLTWNLCKLN